MGSKALSWAWEQKAAGAEGKLALILLADELAGAGTSGELPRARIAEFALIEEAEVSRILDSLVDAGRLTGWQELNGSIRYELPGNAVA